MKNLSISELFEIASKPKSKTIKADSARRMATVLLINKASLKSGQHFSRLLEAVEYLNNEK